MRLETDTTHWPLIEEFVQKSGRFLLKKLARNDTSWADHRQSHQSGFYVPAQVRESGFFPQLTQRQDKNHIFEVVCPTFWPQLGELRNESWLKHYRNKGPEAHFTRLPKVLFSELSPASWLLGGVMHDPIGGAHHWFMIIDSESQDAALLESRLDIQSDFHFGLFSPSDLLLASRIETDELSELIEEIQIALERGTLHQLLGKYGSMPNSTSISEEALSTFLRESGNTSLNPWKIRAPGDAVMKISRDIEFRIYKRHELKHRALQVAQVLATHQNVASAAVSGFPSLDRIFLSASQQRKNRAGKSFELHLARLLRDGGVRFEEQGVLEQRRPDFVLPDRATVAKREKRSFYDAAILSAKTTLRERWKQITHERFNCSIFLATVDDRVSAEALRDLARLEITLVVPESLKESSESLYSKNENVITFRSLFDDELAKKRPSLLLRQTNSVGS
ncbi:MAG: type II restriction endonuclease [Stenotrophomonas sp.]|uniref:type II restriction endonuclease n=1 Tax=Stenotrophomonas sp. TaxID=69392 RepID=UPI003315B08D